MTLGQDKVDVGIVTDVVNASVRGQYLTRAQTGLSQAVTLGVVTDKPYLVLTCEPITGPGSPVTKLSVLVTMEP